MATVIKAHSWCPICEVEKDHDHSHTTDEFICMAQENIYWYKAQIKKKDAKIKWFREKLNEVE